MFAQGAATPGSTLPYLGRRHADRGPVEVERFSRAPAGELRGRRASHLRPGRWRPAFVAARCVCGNPGAGGGAPAAATQRGRTCSGRAAATDREARESVAMLTLLQCEPKSNTIPKRQATISGFSQAGLSQKLLPSWKTGPRERSIERLRRSLALDIAQRSWRAILLKLLRSSSSWALANSAGHASGAVLAHCGQRSTQQTPNCSHLEALCSVVTATRSSKAERATSRPRMQ
jgi:hypothetical protein